MRIAGIAVCGALLPGGCIYMPGGTVEHTYGFDKPISAVAMSAQASDAYGQAAVEKWLRERCKEAEPARVKACAQEAGMTCEDEAGGGICTFRGLVRSRQIWYFLTIPDESSAGPWGRTETEVTMRYGAGGISSVGFKRTQQFPE